LAALGLAQLDRLAALHAAGTARARPARGRRLAPRAVPLRGRAARRVDRAERRLLQPLPRHLGAPALPVREPSRAVHPVGDGARRGARSREKACSAAGLTSTAKSATSARSRANTSHPAPPKETTSS